jgi:hypothetical protein
MISLNPTKSGGEDIRRPQWVRLDSLFSVTFFGFSTTPYRMKGDTPRALAEIRQRPQKLSAPFMVFWPPE